MTAALMAALALLLLASDAGVGAGTSVAKHLVARFDINRRQGAEVEFSVNRSEERRVGKECRN